MDIDTVKNALKARPEYVTVGGGEPTLHPQFLEILCRCIGAAESEGVFVVTNGSDSELSRIIFKLAKSDVIGACLSVDGYHDPIDWDIRKLFTDAKMTRDVTEKEINSGRCDWGTDDGCVCDDPFVQPDGFVRLCGCADSPVIGNVNDPKFSLYKALEKVGHGYEDGRCIKSLRAAEASEHGTTMTCPTCGESLAGDGYTMALHCPNAEIGADIEPDAPAIYCKGDGKCSA